MLGLVNAQSIMHTVFQLYDVLRFDSTVLQFRPVATGRALVGLAPQTNYQAPPKSKYETLSISGDFM